MNANQVVIEKLKIRFAFKADYERVSVNLIFKGEKTINTKLQRIVMIVKPAVFKTIIAFPVSVSNPEMSTCTIDKIQVQIIKQPGWFVLLD